MVLIAHEVEMPVVNGNTFDLLAMSVYRFASDVNRL